MRFLGHLLAACNNNIRQYEKICDLLVDTLVIDSNFSRRPNDEAILLISHHIRPFKSKKNILTRQETYQACRSNAHFPEIIDTLLGKSGIDHKNLEQNL